MDSVSPQGYCIFKKIPAQMQMHRETFCQMSSYTDTTATPVIFLTYIPNREKGILSSCNQTHHWALKYNVGGGGGGGREKEKKENPFKPVSYDGSPTI